MARPVDKIAAKKLDPVTFEILRHRIEENVGEMYRTIDRVSGNLVVTAAGDHQVSSPYLSTSLKSLRMWQN